MDNQGWHIGKSSSKLEQIYYKYSTLMVSLAYQIVKDTDSANDVLHDSIMKIAKNLDKIEDVDSPRTRSYVLTITHSTAIDRFNKQKKGNLVELESVDYDIADEQNVEKEIEQKRDKQYIMDILGKLKPNYNKILTLKYLHELSDSEIADILNISQSLVRKRLERARKSMKKLMVGNANSLKETNGRE